MAKQRGGVFGEDAASNGRAMIHGGIIENREAGANRAAFGIVCTIDEAIDASLQHGSGAHRAGLDGDVDGHPCEAVIAQSRRGRPQGHYLGVRGGIAAADGAVAGARDDLSSLGDHATNRHFSAPRSEAGLGQRQSHAFFVKSSLSGRVAGMVHRASE